MHRSGSASRVSDSNKSSDTDHLPTYDPLSDIAKKEISKLKAAENAVHIIPLVLILCAIILWFLSASEDVTIVSRMGKWTIISGHSNQTS
ncbi:hypothetical protein AAC387_Pa05g1814 [Persea americana]